MLRCLTLFIFVLLFTLCAKAQNEDIEKTTIKETAYQIVDAASRGYKVNVIAVISNPFENKFASRPQVQVTFRGSDGSVISSREFYGAGIPPKSIIALCESIYVDEKPAKVDFRPMSAAYEDTNLKPSEFRQFTLRNIRSRLNNYGEIKITGEVINPYSIGMGAWICFLFRDKSGKLIGGHRVYKSEVPSGEPFAFETDISERDIPNNVESIDKLVFSHYNYQSSWQKVLRP